MIYIDSNVFVHASLSQTKEGEHARDILDALARGGLSGATSVATVDEVIWAVQKVRGKEASAQIAEAMFQLRGLEFVSLDLAVMALAVEIYRHEGLKPRDAMHLATLRLKKIGSILSTDSDFDKIKGIKRIDLSKPV